MNARDRGRIKLLLIALLCALPVLASWLSYRWLPPAGGKSYGQLLATPLPQARQPGWPQGRWVLLDAAANCNPACERRRFAMRQIHTAQGEAAARLVRRQQAEAGLRQDGFYLVDPHGNGVLFYPDGAAPAAVIREIRSVLKNNNSLG
ncbi:hypothetical protein [Vogesella alkaliphila]|uniref:hypothetical protein n=1 Tax=Vogesella alkaliphila TaxID=1193621 RepID=UPI0016733549|nr:hypothetical protein [Vogesella alkaliphila]